MLLCNSQPLKNLYTTLQIRDNKQHIPAAGCLSIIEVLSFFYLGCQNSQDEIC